MEEEKLKINQVKMSVGKTEKQFYYEKMHYADSWTKIPKLNYEYCVKNNLAIATEVLKDLDGNIILLKYKNENSQEKRERQKKEIKSKTVEIDNLKHIYLVKRTIGKTGKHYYYESLSSVENAKDVYWYKTDESFFRHLINSYKKNALNIELDDKGEVVYMEYTKNEKESSKAIISDDNLKKETKGCFKTVILTFVFLIVVLLIITF